MSLFSMGQQLGQMAAKEGLRQAKAPSGGVRRQGETREQFRRRMDNSDIDAVFRGIQQTRTRVHKGLSGMPLNPDGTDPGNSFDRFMRQNPHLGGAAQRQAQYDQQARGYAYRQAAQNSLMRAQDQQPTSKSVVGADGYRSIFDQQGNVVGTTAPVGEKGSRVFDDALGEMVPMDAWSQRKNYVQGTKGMNATAMQQAARKSMTSKPSGMDQIFGGGTKQPSPSGVAGGGVVEPPQPKGAPGGELFGLPQWVLAQELKNSLPADSLRNGQQQRPQYTPMQPNDGPQPIPRLDQTSQAQFMGPEIPSWLLQAPDMPFGETNGTANLRGLFPRLGQGGEEIAALLEDFWNSLSGQPQTAHEQFRRAQQDYARQQYAQGVR